MKTFEHRPYQERIITKAVSGFLGSDRAILIESPTGSGKSYMTTQILGRLAANMATTDNPLRVIWAAHRGKLLDQALMEAAESGILDSGLIEFNPLSTFTKDQGLIDSLKNSSIIVYDEAQHSVSDTSIDLIHAIEPKYMLGLSATPFRSDNIKLAFDAVIRDAGINRLIKDGYLSQYDMYAVEKYTPEYIADVYLKNPEMWGKSIAFWHTHEESEKFVSILNAAGARVKGLYGSMHAHAKEHAIEAFEDGSIDVLSNIMLLTEGFDFPKLNTVFCKPSCKGVTIQMAGRALRKHEDKSIANIVQLGPSKGHDFKFAKLAHPRNTFELREGEWIQDGIDRDRLDRLHGATRRVSAQMAISGELADTHKFFEKKALKKFATKLRQIESNPTNGSLSGDQYDNRQE